MLLYPKKNTFIVSDTSSDKLPFWVEYENLTEWMLLLCCPNFTSLQLKKRRKKSPHAGLKYWAVTSLQVGGGDMYLKMQNDI